MSAKRLTHHFPFCPNEILVEILLKLDPTSLAATAQISRVFATLVREDSFQRAYTSLTLKKYNNIMDVKIPDIFGKALAGEIQTLLKRVPLYVYGTFFQHLISEKNIPLLKGNEHSLAKEISQTFLNKNDKDVDPDINIVKFFAITSRASSFFTADMNVYHRAAITRALAPLSIEQIGALAQKASKLLTEAIPRPCRPFIIQLLAQDFVKA